MDPSVRETSGVISRERAGLAGFAGQGAGQQVCFDQHLKAIADADDRLAGRDEIEQTLTQMMGNLIGENSPGGDVVAVAESARDGEGLVILQLGGRFEQSIDVQAFSGEAGGLEGEGGFAIAIGAGCANDQGAWEHGDSVCPRG